MPRWVENFHWAVVSEGGEAMMPNITVLYSQSSGHKSVQLINATGNA